ncbi:MAG: hypothetical protein Tsb0020_24940 [Haliangiales bacterium]
MAALLAAGSGCSDDASGTPSPDAAPPDAPPPDAYAGDGVAPTVDVIFPPPSSLTDTPSITVRGTAEDVDAITEILVNGMAATTTDGYATWSATIALEHGVNAIAIQSEDEYGAVDTMAAEISVKLSAYWTDSPTTIVADNANGRAFALDSQLDALLTIDYATGERVSISDDLIGVGPTLGQPVSLALDVAGGRAFVADQSPARILLIGLDDGAREVIADDATGTGPVLLNPVSVVLDAANSRLLILDVDDGAAPAPPVLYALDLTEGDTFGERTVVVDADNGDGDDFVAPVALALDPAGGRALVGEPARNPEVGRVYSVDLETGERTLVTISDDTDQGNPFTNPLALAFDPSDDPATRFFMLDEGNDTVYAVDLETGVRTVVAEDRVSPGPDFSVPIAMDLDVDEDGNARLLVADSGLDAFLSVAIDDGARAVLSNVSLGEGAPITTPAGMFYDARGGDAGRVLILEGQDDLLIEVDLATSTRKVIVDDEGNPAEVFGDPQNISPDFEYGLAPQTQDVSEVVVADVNKDAVFSVDVASGAIVVLSGDKNDGTGDQVGAGDPLVEPRGVIFDPGDGVTPARYLVVDGRDDEPGALVAIDPETGDRTIISDNDTGAGDIKLGDPVDLTLELGASGPTGRVLVVDSDPDVLFAIDLATGDRTVISGAGAGDGNALENPLTVSMELEAGPDGSYQSTGYALVVHNGVGSVLAIELSNGRRTVLIDDTVGKGPLIDAPRSLWLLPENNLLLLADNGLDALVLLDRTNNDRVLLSR